MLIYDIDRHKVCYETSTGIKHVLDCDFTGIFDKLKELLSSNDFSIEVPYEGCYDGDYYTFKYDKDGMVHEYSGYIYGLSKHNSVVESVSSCSKDVIDEELSILRHEIDCSSDILARRHELHERVKTLPKFSMGYLDE